MNIKKKLEKYLKENREAIPKKELYSARACFECDMLQESASIDTYIENNKESDTFQIKLFNYIDKKQLKDSDVYNKVNIDRRLFSKIRSDKNYHPSKDTIILLAISLELTESEVEDLLESASYSLPKNSTYDLIIRFCFKEQIYNLTTINELLYEYNCHILNV